MCAFLFRVYFLSILFFTLFPTLTFSKLLTLTSLQLSLLSSLLSRVVVRLFVKIVSIASPSASIAILCQFFYLLSNHNFERERNEKPWTWIAQCCNMTKNVHQALQGYLSYKRLACAKILCAKYSAVNKVHSACAKYSAWKGRRPGSYVWSLDMREW